MAHYNFSRPGYKEITSHATQLLWRSTRRAGCAINPTCAFKTYICQYTPPGNVIGGRGYPANWATQVFPRGSLLQPAAAVQVDSSTDGSPAANLDGTAVTPAYGQGFFGGLMGGAGGFGGAPMGDGGFGGAGGFGGMQPPGRAFGGGGMPGGGFGGGAPPGFGGGGGGFGSPYGGGGFGGMQQGGGGGFAAPPGGSGFGGMQQGSGGGFGSMQQGGGGGFAAPPRGSGFGGMQQGGGGFGGAPGGQLTNVPTGAPGGNPGAGGDTTGLNTPPPPTVGPGGSGSPAGSGESSGGSGTKPTGGSSDPHGFEASGDEETVPDPDPLPAPSNPTATPADEVAKGLLKMHNDLRAKHGAPVMQWDPALVATAGNWAAKCPKGHSGIRGIGENMAWWVCGDGEEEEGGGWLV